MEDLVKQYDTLYNTLMDSAEILNIQNPLKMSGIEEMELLNRISILEQERDEQNLEIQGIKGEKNRLEQKVEGLTLEKRHIETINEKLGNQEEEKIRNLNDSLSNLKDDLAKTEKRIKDLETENEQLLMDSEQAEMRYNKDLKEEKLRADKATSQAQHLEDLRVDFEKKIADLERELLENKNNLNKLKSKGNSYHKNYNMMQQMYKSNEVQVKSLEKEVGTLRDNNKRNEKEKESIRSGAELLAIELINQGMEREQIFDILGSTADLMRLEDVLEANMSVDTEFEKALHQNQIGLLTPSTPNLGSFEFDQLAMPSPIFTPMNFKKQQFSFNNDFEDKRTSIFKKDPELISPREEIKSQNNSSDHLIPPDKMGGPSLSQKGSQIDPDQYKSQIEDQIDKQIRLKSKSKAFEAGSGANDDMPRILKNGTSIEIRENSLSPGKYKKHFQELTKGLNDLAFSQIEKQSMSQQIEKVNNMNGLAQLLFDFLNSKTIRMVGEAKGLISEKSKFC